MYDSARKSGYLFNALAYDSKKKRKSTKTLEHLIDDGEHFEDEEKENILNFFKRCVMPQDRKDVEKKMKQTKAFRREVIVNNFPKYKECWQFYFVSPDLVSGFNFVF